MRLDWSPIMLFLVLMLKASGSQHGYFCLQAHLAFGGEILVVTSGKVLLPFVGLRQGMLLNILYCTRCSHHKEFSRDFHGGPAVKNLPAKIGDMGSIRGWGSKIPRAAEQLSPCTTTTEPAL